MADHQHINYTSKDIEMYLNGQLTSGQMHAMEKAALDDPMLADALEGFASVDINKIKPGSQELHDRLKQRLSKEEKQLTPIVFLKRNKWLRIAAMFILIAGVGLVITWFSFNQNENDIAVTEKISVDSGSQEDIAITNNEIAIQDSTVAGTNAVNKKEELVSSKNIRTLKSGQTDQISTEKITGESVDGIEVQTENAEAAAKLQQTDLADRQAKEIIATETMNAKRDVTQNAFAKRAEAKMEKPMGRISATSQPLNKLSGRVTDEKNNPVPYAVINNQKENVLVATDSAGYFSMLSIDTTITVDISSLGFQNSTAFLQDRKRNNIVLKESSESLNEVVVTGYGSRKKIPGSQLPPEPIAGWENYFKYLDEKQSRKGLLSPGQYKGIVELSFTINKKGQPENIKVLNTDCIECNTEAIRLVKEGPAWKFNGSNRGVKLQVSFTSK